MVTKIHTHEGVPIGGNNFEEFMSYIRSFLGANFGFSTNALENQGGFFVDDDFRYTALHAVVPGTYAWFFTPHEKPVGSLFGRLGTEMFKFDVLRSPFQARTWTILPTNTVSEESDRLLFHNVSAIQKQLPYRPLRRVEISPPTFAHGYEDVRLNGVPQVGQADHLTSFTNTAQNFLQQSLQFNRIRMGAEFPRPVHNGLYDATFLNPSAGVTRAELANLYDSTLSFEFTNFSTELGGHILLWRREGETNYFSYIPQDLGSGAHIPVGTYRVLDYSRGTIRLNISTEQIARLGPGANENTRFIIVSAEQLLEDVAAEPVSYLSRYGLYDGNVNTTTLVEYIFDGASGIVREIPEAFYSSAVGNVLLEDVNRSFADGVILAIEYYAVPNVNVIRDVQKNRHKPDTIQLYYYTGIIGGDLSSTINIRAVVEQNPGSWYNRDVLDAEYFPVNRTDETFYSLISVVEAPNFAVTFNPNQPFRIIDTIRLRDLADVGAISLGDVIYFDGTNFVGRNFSLRNLLDVQPGVPDNGDILQFETHNNRWSRRTLTQILTQTPGAIPTAATILAPLTYGTGVTTFSPTQLVSRRFVEDGDNAIISLLDSHIGATSVHGATSAPSASRIMMRDAVGLSSVATPPNEFTPGSTNIVNVAWVNNMSTVATANNTLVRRGPTGITSAESPPSVSFSTSRELVNIDWITRASTSIQSPFLLVRRDGSGRFRAHDPSDPFDVANRRYVDAGDVNSNIALQDHIGRPDVHHATPALVANRIIMRDVNARASVNPPPLGFSSDNQIINVNWINGMSVSAPWANTLVRRDGDARFRSAWPAHEHDVTNVAFVNHRINESIVQSAIAGSAGRPGFVVLGPIVLVWGEGHRNNAGRLEIIGPSLPAGTTYTILNVFATGMALHNHPITVSVDQPGHPDNRTRMDADGRRPRVGVHGFVHGTNIAWATSILWVIRRN